MTLNDVPYTADALQSELLMDMCESVDDALLQHLDQIGHVRRSPDVLSMEIEGSRQRQERVAALRPLIEMYCQLLARGTFTAQTNEHADLDLTDNDLHEVRTHYLNYLNASAVAIIANLFDKGIVQYAPKDTKS
ncbi:hypothetical protein AB0H73_05985 [Streptomyces olivoreticuli]